MTVTMKDNPKFAEGTSKRRKILDEFFIDYGRCMRCNICVEVCNFDAISMNNTWAGHELSTVDGDGLRPDPEPRSGRTVRCHASSPSAGSATTSTASIR